MNELKAQEKRAGRLLRVLLDMFVVLATSIFLLIGFFSNQGFFTDHGVYIMTGFFFVVSIPYRKHTLRFLFIVLATLFVSLILILLSMGLWTILFVFYVLKFIGLGSILGYALMYVFWLITEQLHIPRAVNVGIIAILIGFALLQLKNVRNDMDLVKQAYTNRTLLITDILRAVSDGNIDTFDNTSLINLGLIEGIYRIEEDQIIHEYGGTVDLVSDGEKVSLIYVGIPPGDICFTFFNFDNPKHIGFPETLINNVKPTSTIDRDLQRNKKEECFLSEQDNSYVTITFSGTIKEIQRRAYNKFGKAAN